MHSFLYYRPGGGDSISVGQPVGLAGNSGYSLEPHLHIQAHVRTHSGLPWYAEEQAYILFEGKGYRLNERIVAE